MKNETKNIWVPKSETKVTIDTNGDLHVWDEMTMELKAIQRPSGFSVATQSSEKD